MAKGTTIESKSDFPRSGNLRQMATSDWAGAGIQYLESPVVNPLQESDRDQPIIIAWEGAFARKFKFPPYNPDDLIKEKGYQTMDEMKSCGAYWSALCVLWYAVLYKQWSVKPHPLKADDPRREMAQKLADELQWHCDNIVAPGDVVQDFRAVLFELLNACHIGFSLSEIIWRCVKPGEGPKNVVGQWGFQWFSPKRARQLGFDLDPHTLMPRNITNRSYYGGGIQFNIPPEKVLFYTFNPSDGLPHGRGVARPCYKHTWSLDIMQKLWVIALEHHGSPHFIAKGPTANKDAQKAIEYALEAFRAGANGVFPEGFEIDLIKLQEGDLDGFQKAVQWHTQQIAKVVLLQELTTGDGEQGGGSYALGGVHQTTQEYALSFVRRDLERVISLQLFRRWVRYNYGPEYVDLTPVLDLGDWDAADRLLNAQALQPMLQEGVIHRSEKFLRGLMGYPDADPATQAQLDKEAELRLKKPEPAAEPKGQDNRTKKA